MISPISLALVILLTCSTLPSVVYADEPDGSYAVAIPTRDRWIALGHRHTGMVIIKDHTGETVEVLHLEDQDGFTPTYELQRMHEIYTYRLVKE